MNKPMTRSGLDHGVGHPICLWTKQMPPRTRGQGRRLFLPGCLSHDFNIYHPNTTDDTNPMLYLLREARMRGDGTPAPGLLRALRDRSATGGRRGDQRPRSCIRIEREKQMVFLVKRLIRVRKVRCLRSIFCVCCFPTVCVLGSRWRR